MELSGFRTLKFHLLAGGWLSALARFKPSRDKWRWRGSRLAREIPQRKVDDAADGVAAGAATLISRYPRHAEMRCGLQAE
jgi:hypothetical protein